jgi:hypothetical protein
MKRVFLLMVVSALLVTLGFAQTPDAGSNTDQANIKGCLGGSDGNYTVAEDGTRQIFKITTSGVDLKPHLGHDVKLTGHKVSGAVSSGVADNSFAVTELNMISEHCAAAAAAPVATVIPSSETVIAPVAAAAASSATASTPAADAAAPPATASPSSATVSTPAADAAHPTRLSAHPRRLSATQAAAATAPAATVSPSSKTVSPSAADTAIANAATPAATASPSSETASTPAAAATTPAVTHGRGSLSLLIAFAVLVIVLGTMAPLVGRWRKRKILERTGTPNLSFTKEASSDRDKPELRKVA